MSKYSEKFKDPRWQKKRLQVLERDNWECQICHDTENTLNIHHRYYKKDTDPWDYPSESLITLCEDCHEIETAERPKSERSILHVLRKHFMYDDILSIASGIHYIKLQHEPDVVASVYGWAFGNPDIQTLLIEMYFKHLGKADNRG